MSEKLAEIENAGDTRHELRARLAGCLPDEAERWLAAAMEEVARDPAVVRTRFPAAGRRCGRGHLATDWTVDDAARALLLAALPLRGAELGEEIATLYRYGDAAEKRGVLRGLHLVDTVGASGLPLVHDGLRTNDTRLVTAALGPYGATHLDAAAYRQGVLKCVFSGIPLAGIHGLRARADAPLARMLADYARERIAAGRDVPADVWPLIERHPETAEAAGLREELDSATPARRAAAARAFADRAAAARWRGAGSASPNPKQPDRPEEA